MKMIIIAFVTIIMLCSYACGYCYSFKEQYKKWYKKLFMSNIKPAQWSISRMRNHNRYIATLWSLSISIIAFFIFAVSNMEEPFSIWVPIASLFCIAILSIVAYFIGKDSGKKACDKRVRKECKKFEYDIVDIWKNLQVYLGDFIYIYDILKYFKIHSSINLLYGIKFQT